MCHHYETDRLAHWEREFETEEDETPDDEPEPEAEELEREDREPATPPADD